MPTHTVICIVGPPAAKEQHGLDLDKKKIQVAEPIKSFGTFEIPIKLHPQVTGTLNVVVQEA